MEALTVSIDSLFEYEGNPRRGNIQELSESLKANGQYKPIVVHKSTRQILAGNHIWKAAKELGWTEIAIVEADVDDEAAKKIVAADNRLAELGTYDEKALLDLLQSIDLNGTGYQTADIDDLLALMEEQIPKEWSVAKPESQYENFQQRPTLADRASHYAERTVRLLMCEYPNEQYIWVVERLQAIRKEHNIDSNAEAILKILSDVSGQEHP